MLSRVSSALAHISCYLCAANGVVARGGAKGDQLSPGPKFWAVENFSSKNEKKWGG